MSAASDHLRDMGARCLRCGASPRVACRKWTFSVRGMKFVFPCSTTREEAEAAIRAGAVLLGEMYRQDAIDRWADDGGRA